MQEKQQISSAWISSSLVQLPEATEFKLDVEQQFPNFCNLRSVILMMNTYVIIKPFLESTMKALFLLIARSAVIVETTDTGMPLVEYLDLPTKLQGLSLRA